MARIAAALGIAGAPGELPGRIADNLEATFAALGMPTRLNGLGIERARLPQVLELSLTNFNADPRREFVRERDLLAAILDAAW
jgi:alcohol dehydrogenase class IV